LFITRGCPAHLRSHKGPEFCAPFVREWLAWLAVRTLFIEPGSPWENGYSEALNGKLRDELLDREIFYTPHEPQIPIDGRRQHHNTVPPLSALGYRPPAAEWPPLARSPRLALGQVSLPKPQLIFEPDSRGRSSLLGTNLGVDQSVGAGHMHETALPLGDHGNS
jgi:hypothetical protein